NAWWTDPGGLYTTPNTIETGPLVTPGAATSSGVRVRYNHFLDRPGCCARGRVQTRLEPSGDIVTAVNWSSSTGAYVSQVTQLSSLTSAANVTFHLRFSYEPFTPATPGMWAVDDVQVYLPGANATQVEFQ
ncbi:MAG: hypothetical protein Q8R92_00365, partial [Deltaproteobacteria bacterium]|nr:hypothetical protein [Deltaproteobacteria bacterium]